jgi:hypothetical protein
MSRSAAKQISGQHTGWPDATTTKQTKEHKMKTVKNNIIAAGIALAVAMAVWVPTNLNAQEQGSAKGGAQLLMKPMTVGDVNRLEPGDMVAMSCPKCKTVTVTYIDKTTKGAIKEEKATQKHLCAGCETIIKTEGRGKQAKDVVVHVCKTCGSEDAFCCVMKKGSLPTKGMEKE